MAGFCYRGNGPLVSVKFGEWFDWAGSCWLLRNNCSTQLVSWLCRVWLLLGTEMFLLVLHPDLPWGLVPGTPSWMVVSGKTLVFV